MRELYDFSIGIDGIDRKLNDPANITFSRLAINADDNEWAENEPVKLTLAGSLAFKGTASVQGYSFDQETVIYEAEDGLAHLVRNPCPMVHEWYNRVKSSHVDNEPINQTIHDIIQTEFAT